LDKFQILALGDVQVCPQSYAIVDRFFDKLLELYNPNVLVLPGDLFEYNSYTNNYIPASTVIQPYADFFKELTNRGTQIIIVAGNHDKTYGDFSNATDIFRGPNIHNTSDDICAVDIGPVRFICVPWLMMHQYESKEQVLGSIKNLKSDLIPILVGHLRVIDAKDGGYKVKKSEYSFMFSVDDLADLGIEYGILGDIHKYQNVINKMDYIGSIRQRHFGESGNPTKVRLITINNGLVVDQYDDLSYLMPQYIIKQCATPDELEDFVQSDLDSANQYRAEFNFETKLRPPKANIKFRCLKDTSTNKHRKLNIQSLGTKLTPEIMIGLYNRYTKELTTDEEASAITFFGEHKYD
jgi:DNA repair exonuclease SbcCD nuclease subunit